VSNGAAREWLARLWATLRRRRTDADLEEELRLHLELAADEAQRSGSSPADARLARLSAGSLTGAIEAQRDQRGLPWLEDLWRDVRYAARTLSRSRSFTVVAVLSLALGIGANTAIFTFMDAVLFRTLPIEQPGRMFFVGHDSGPDVELSSNYPIFERYRAVPVFSGVTAYRGRTFRVATPDGVERVAGQYVSGNYHAVLRAPMALGRGFSSEVDRRPGASMLAVISHEYWMTRFTGSADVLGKTLMVSDRPVTIVGVTAEGFHGLNAGERLHLTLPMSVMALDESAFFDAHDGWTALTIVGRLAPRTSETQALAAADVVFQQFMQEPENRWARAVNQQRFRTAALVPAARGTFSLRKQYGQPLWILMSMVAVLLLIACANVASLLMARSTDRREEFALRLSIGAGRSRIVRQLLTETALLALLGGAGGMLVAVWGTGAILSVFATGRSPAVIDATLNARVLGVTTAVVFLTTLGVGLLPALRATRVDFATALKDGAPRISGARRPALGTLLVIAQIALCLVLVTAAGLLSRSLTKLHGLDAGFSRDRVLLADVDISGARLPGEARLQLFSSVLERMRSLPGVESASFAMRTPIDWSTELKRIEVPGFAVIPENGVSTNTVTPDYFRTFGLPLRRGRAFTDADRAGTPPVGVISQAMAHHFFGGADPLGKTFVLGDNRHATTIVGVVDDLRQEQLRSSVPTRMLYLPLSQVNAGLDGSLNAPNRLTMAIRTAGDRADAAGLVRGEVRSLNRGAFVLYVRTMAQQIDAAIIPERLLTTLSTSFAGVALVLACVGLSGVMAYNVARRRREIGVRLALGAVPGTVLREVLREASIVAAIGVGIGLPIALVAGRSVSAFLFDLGPYDAGTLAGATGALVAVALIAGLFPARRAALTDPVEALRDR
jgi:macrolide transport system ATP-binding/permease protein